MALTTRDLGPEDAEAIAALMLRIEADHPTGFCLAAGEVVEIMRDKADAVFDGAFDGDHLVAYTAVMPSLLTDRGQRFTLFGDVDPRRLGEGLGTLMLGRSVDRARAIHGDDGSGGPFRIAGAALADRDDQAELMRSACFDPGRHSFLMVAELPDGPPGLALPAGVTVEQFDPEASDELRNALNAAFADYPEFIDISREFWTLFMVTSAHTRHALSVVARDACGSVAAFVFAHEYAVPPSGGAGPEVHVPYVGTLHQHRGRGLATALLSRVLHLSRSAGYATASLNVDTANPTGALGIYERAGFRQLYRQDYFHLDA
ncbi:GNAT family N-acetyltransferase [Nocardioides zhouii]|uniref:GNAT family N-acetyltransferase n=1 Tax=Nocardioides zhouii TaxID=1168729 RepID=A0A4Q2T9Y8_9ACTN|nr:GNAT family N-acetyltransferase [Nocardioides zhouii]RYC13659.1 GNAT family N-acetyltransferase [Nocardioides zhouii]